METIYINNHKFFIDDDHGIVSSFEYEDNSILK